MDIPGERPKRSARLEKIAHWIEDDNFVRADFAYAICAEDGKRYRVNGNHTSTVLCNCIDSEEFPAFPENVPLVIEEWTCDTLAEVIYIFDTYDNPVSVRSSDDKLGVYIAQYDDLASVTRDAVKAAVKGVNAYRLYMKNADYPPTKAREMGTLLQHQQVRNYCRFVADFGNSVYDGWKRPGINAAIFQSWMDDPAVATIVWEELFGETDPDPTSRSRMFVTKMRTYEARKGKPADFFYRQFVSHWKAAKREANATASNQ